MKRIIPFAKVEATGNDFIVLNDRDVVFEWLTPEIIKEWCDRHFGIGADGLIYVTFKELKIPRMHFFNADGSRGEMCGNGLRALAQYLLTIGVCDKKHENTIEADDGVHAYYFDEQGPVTVELLVEEVRQALPELQQLNLPPTVNLLGFKKIGVPHLVLQTNEPEFREFEALGRRLRSHPIFGKAGTNVNLIYQIDENTLRVRTYERGVEAETLSCGTGVMASSLLFWEKQPHSEPTLNIVTRGGNLKVERKEGRLFLSGAANVVFVGYIILNR